MRPRPAPDPGMCEKIEFLRDPRHYPDHSDEVDVIETHFAWVFLTRRHAYKMKKPMQQATMDYRTLESRERGCRNELKLNRRLAPSVYLDVVPLIRRRSGELALRRGRNIVDWLVKMYRLPAFGMLDRAIGEGTVRSGDLDVVLELLSAFYKNTQRAPLSEPAYLERLQAITRHNASDLRAPDLALSSSRVDPVIHAQLAYIAGAESLLESRAAHLVDGHGDLRPEHVYLGPQPCVIDCLEFDPELRRLDPAEEIANLALGCGRLGRSDLAEQLLQRYRTAMKDPVPDHLLQFYSSQRAVIGAKIAAWHVRDPRYTRREPWIARANSFLDDAIPYARSALRDNDNENSLLIARHRPPAQQRDKGSAR
jgi:uncharacterized protein